MAAGPFRFHTRARSFLPVAYGPDENQPRPVPRNAIGAAAKQCRKKSCGLWAGQKTGPLGTPVFMCWPRKKTQLSKKAHILCQKRSSIGFFARKFQVTPIQTAPTERNIPFWPLRALKRRVLKVLFF